VKVGRTHLQDATPITLGQELGAMVAQLDFSINNIEEKIEALSHLAVGGTAVGTGLNAHVKFGELTAKYIAKETNHKLFKSADNKFFALCAHDALLEMSAAIRTLASSLMKIANDIRWLASGPRCGIGEIYIPENEPGSSIMPGKVNPTQCEALTMICAQIYGNDATVAFAASQGNFQLNVFKPVMVHNVLESIDLLVDAIPLFTKYCTDGIVANTTRIEYNLEQDLMLVTALNEKLGYDVAAQIAKYALRHNISLLKASKDLQLLTEDEYKQAVDPLSMTNLDRSIDL
jgi:fumarate hydratase class II